MLAAHRILHAAAPPLVLDELGVAAAAAYSLRQLRNAYTGAAINVTRSSDGTTSAIGFSGGSLDTTALLAFVGSGNGFVNTWYDQSGNGLNLTQSTAASQPQIVASGALYEFSSRPYFYVNGAGINGGGIALTNSAITTFESGPSTANIVSVYESEHNYPGIIGSYNGGNLVYGYNGSSAVGAFRLNGASTSFSYSAVSGSPLVYSFLTAGITSGAVTAAMYANGTSEGTASVSGYGTQASGAGVGNLSYSSDTLSAYFAEATVFASQLSTTDRSTLENNQLAYY